MRLWHRATLSKQGTSGGVPRFDMAPAVLASRAKGGQVRTKVANASCRHLPTYDSCLVTLTGLVLRVLPRLALRVRTRATYACLASTCWLSITLGALLSADTAGSHFYGGSTADGCRESALCFTAVSQAQRRRACVCRTRRGLRARVRAQASSSAPPGACGPCCAVKFVMCAACPLGLARCARVSAPARGARLCGSLPTAQSAQSPEIAARGMTV